MEFRRWIYQVMSDAFGQIKERFAGEEEGGNMDGMGLMG